jgi:asparagine synthase (glutamine-hydrolysing)
MCGIAGIVALRNEGIRDKLVKMTNALSHRGPDGEGFFVHHDDNNSIGLGHRRLSIIDLSTSANQPMEYNGLHIVFNGEIYNYNEIRNELIGLGHNFKTHSDTEVILHSWREWKEECIVKWKGMFSIVLFDQLEQKLFCIRDRAGVKPFYYYLGMNVFLFASELKALVANSAFRKKLNRSAVASFLQYGYVSQPHSIYEDVYKLPAGHLLQYDLRENGYQVRQYWNVYDYYNKPKLNISLPDAIRETEKILTKAFKYRMVADVPVGVFLSGGYDSSCVTALLQKNASEKIKTFTIGTADDKLNEAPYAKEIAKHLGTEHTEYYCTHKEALEIIPELPYYYDEPFADSSAIPTILVSRLARKKVTVALSADAGDEIFAGYNRYDYISRYGGKISSIPRPIRKLAATAMESISSEKIPYLRDKQNFHSRYDKLKNLLNDPSPAELLKNLSQVFTSKEIKELFNEPVSELTTAHNSIELKSGYSDPLSYMMAIDYQTYMVDDILHKVDRATMSVSLEGREPFLDQDIIEWAAQIPSEHKYYNGQKKFILKQIVHKYIPKEIMERPKMGFGIPMERWLSSELKELVLEHLSEKNLNVHGLFNTTVVNKLLTDFFKGRKEKHLKIWYLLMFQMWYKQWMQNPE